jgi:hypothetical protein
MPPPSTRGFRWTTGSAIDQSCPGESNQLPNGSRPARTLHERADPAAEKSTLPGARSPRGCTGPVSRLPCGCREQAELWKPWANDPESFERAVLADLEQSVGGHTPELMRELGREFRGARLDGSYPNTEIVVNCLDLNTGNVKETRFPCGKMDGDPASAGRTLIPRALRKSSGFGSLIEPL